MPSLRHQRKAEIYSQVPASGLEGLEFRADKEGALPGQSVGYDSGWVGRVVGSVLLLSFCNYIWNSEILM